MPLSNKGPENKIMTSKRLRTTSPKSMGQYPSSLTASEIVVSAFFTAITRAPTVLSMHVRVTMRIRLRMTDGASRLRVGDGLVDLDK